MFNSLYITKSRIRRDLLALFFSNPSKSYYLRELQRMLGYSAGSIRRELLKFKEDRLFSVQKVGNLLYYTLNRDHPLFSELKGIIDKTIGIEGSLKKALLSVNGVEAAFIYGSFASGKANATSDIDLMILGDPDTSKVNEKLVELERKLKRDINLSLYDPKKYRERKKKKTGFITELLNKPKIMLVGEESALYGD